jgi:phage terminase large subunit-like protein
MTTTARRRPAARKPATKGTATTVPAGYPAPSVRIERFFTRHLRHVKGEWAGQPFALEDWQRDELIRPVYDRLRVKRGAALRQCSEALVGIAKKNGKTTLTAGLGAYSLYSDGYYVPDGDGWRWKREAGAEVYNVAGSKPQARVLFDIARTMVEASPMLAAQSKIYRDAIEVRSTGSVWRVMAADAKLAHGPNPSVAVIDEIWTHPNEELYEAFASAGAARRQPLILVITTAGWDKDTIAHRLYLRGKRKPSARFHYRWWESPAGAAIDDHKAWSAANPSKWVTMDYLEGELARARESGNEASFRRWHMNQWTSGREVAIPADLWARGAARPRIPDGADVLIVIDSAPKKDSTAVAVVHRDAGGMHNVRVEHLHVDPEIGYLDYEVLKATIREAARRYSAIRVLFDPYNVTQTMLELAEEGLPVEEVPQHDSRMVPASETFYQLLSEGKIRHGNARELSAQAANAGKRVSSDRGWRFSKTRSAGVIDGIIAAAIGCYYAELGFEEELPPLLLI